MPVQDIPVSTLTQATLAGEGIFDVLMRATKAHLEEEYGKNRIKGAEYSTVYLGSLESTMRTALEFLVQGKRLSLETELLSQQILLAEVEVQKAQAELAILLASVDKVPAEIALLEAQTAQSVQQTANLLAESANIVKQGVLLDAQSAQSVQQTANLLSEKALTDARVTLTDQQAVNAITEGLVLTAQKCKLDAEFDVLQVTKLKTTEEVGLLAQKRATEKAQTVELGVDENSVIGRQKQLYTAQSAGFSRDAEQKAAKILADSWSVRRTTDEGTVADGVNLLNDATVGRAIGKLLTGVGA